MTVNEAMARADGLRLNTLEEQQKAEWLRQLDGQIWEMIGNVLPEEFGGPHAQGRKGWPWDPVWPEEDPVLLLSGPYEDLYPLYLICKIDYYNQEMDLYANDMVQYNAALAEAKAWWRRNHRPRPSENWTVM